MTWIVPMPNGVVSLQIPSECPILEYEKVLVELFESGFPQRLMIENMTGKTKWVMPEMKEHFKRIKQYAALLTPEHRVAIVASGPHEFASGKTAQGALESIFPCQIEVFYDTEQAHKWLVDAE